MGVQGPEFTIDHGDHLAIVRPSKDNPQEFFPVDQLVVHGGGGCEHFVRLFSGMRPEKLRARIKKTGVQEIQKIWLHSDEARWEEYQQLLYAMWSKVKAFLRSAKARTQEALLDAIAAALKTITAQDANGWFLSCGYNASQV